MDFHTSAFVPSLNEKKFHLEEFSLIFSRVSLTYDHRLVILVGLPGVFNVIRESDMLETAFVAACGGFVRVTGGFKMAGADCTSLPCCRM